MGGLCGSVLDEATKKRIQERKKKKAVNAAAKSGNQSYASKKLKKTR